MDPLAAGPALAGLPVMTELVVQDMEDEAAGDPWSGQTRADLDPWLGAAAIAAEAQMAQSPMRWVPRPADLMDRWQGWEPGAADKLRQDLEIWLGSDGLESGEEGVVPFHRDAGPAAQDPAQIFPQALRGPVPATMGDPREQKYRTVGT